MQGVYIGDHRVLLHTAWNSMLIVSTQDLSMSTLLMTSGIHEPLLTQYIINNVNPGDTVFDLGAHLGYFTVLLARLVEQKGKVVAYEANPTMYNLLRDNISINYLTPQCTLLPKAIYSSTTTLPFYVTERFSCNSSIYERNDDYLLKYNDVIKKITVETDTLDHYANTFSKIDLIKIDIEGGEYQAFLGMQNLISKGIVEKVVFELNKDMLKENWIPFFNLLASFRDNYDMDFYLIQNDGELSLISLDHLINMPFVPNVVMKKS